MVGTDVKGFEVGDEILLSFNSCGGCRTCTSGSPAVCTGTPNWFATRSASGITHDRDMTTTAWIPLNYVCPREGTAQTVGRQEEDGQAVRVRHKYSPTRGARLLTLAFQGLFFGQSSFAGHSIVSPRSCVKVPKGSDLINLSPLGCGIQTGAGTVINGLKAGPGDSIAVWGLGGVGMAALLAAVHRKCAIVIAIDVVTARLDLARELGATHVINGKDADLVDQVRNITGGKGLNFT